MIWTGHHHLDLHAAGACIAQRLDEWRRRDEVRVGDVKRAPCPGDDSCDAALRRAAGISRSALYYGYARVSAPIEVRKIARAEYELAGGLVPVVDESGLQRRDRRTAHANVAIAPVA